MSCCIRDRVVAVANGRKEGPPRRAVSYTYLAEAAFAEHDDEIEVGRTDEILFGDAVDRAGRRRPASGCVVRLTAAALLRLARRLHDRTRRSSSGTRLPLAGRINPYANSAIALARYRGTEGQCS